MSSTDAPAQQQQQKVLEGQELLDAIRRQVEFYLSRQNLQSDAFLVSQMDSQQSVPLSLIAGFKIMRQMNATEELIRSAMKDSDQVTLVPGKDGSEWRIRPNISQPARNTIIIREIPKDTTKEAILSLFASGNTPQSLKPELGDTWWATFENEELATAALEHLRSQRFQDKPVKARIKSETILRSDTRALSATASEFIPSTYSNSYYHPQQQHFHGVSPMYAWDPYMQHPGAPFDYRNPAQGGFRRGGRAGNRAGSNARRGGAGPADNDGGSASGRKQRRSQQRHQNGSSASTKKHSKARTGARALSSDNSTANSGVDKKTRPTDALPPNFGPASFPPLPKISPANTSGYGNENFISYDKQRVIDVHNALVAKIAAGERPADMVQNVAGVVQTPHTQLELTKPPLADNTVVSPTGPMEREAIEEMFSVATAKIVNAESSANDAPAGADETTSATATNITPSIVAPPTAASTSQNKSFVEVALHAKDIQPPRRSSISLNKKVRSRAGSRVDDKLRPSADLLARARSKIAEAAAKEQQQGGTKEQAVKKKSTSTKGKTPSTEPKKQSTEESDDMKVVVRRGRFPGRPPAHPQNRNKKTVAAKEAPTKAPSEKRVRAASGNKSTNGGASSTERRQRPNEEKSYASIASKKNSGSTNSD